MPATNRLSLASETVLYAAKCLRLGERELALDVIRDSAGLSSEQRQAIEKIIEDLGAAKLTPNDLNLAEGRMIRVLNPENLSPLHFRAHNLIISAKTNQKTLELSSHLLNHCEPGEIVGCFSELESLEIDALSISYGRGHQLQAIAEGITTYCPKFSCLIYSGPLANAQELISPFSNLIKKIIWAGSGKHEGERACTMPIFASWVKMPHLKEIIFTHSLLDGAFSRPEIFAQFTQLEKLTVTLYAGLYDYNADSKLAVLAHIPNLRVLDVRGSPLSYGGVRQFVNARKQTLEQITLSLRHVFDSTHVERLRAEFPSVEFVT